MSNPIAQKHRPHQLAATIAALQTDAPAVDCCAHTRNRCTHTGDRCACIVTILAPENILPWSHNLEMSCYAPAPATGFPF
ncbi:hypothetical protein SOVF_176510 [Spinacia oleracea]|nr:hypothetical protein SOVF_176510 [Spinacia oleracea]